MSEEQQLVETYHSPFSSLKQNKPIAIGFIVAVIFVFFYMFFIAPPKDYPVGSIYDLKSGQTLSIVSENFTEMKMIRSGFWFKVFTYILSFGKAKIYEGEYALHEKENVFTLAWRVSHGDLQLTPVKITIPEGMNSYEISKLISDNFPSFDKNKFEKIVQNKKLEGYLFPDTYFFLPDMTEEDIIKIMTDNFDEKIKSLDNEIKTFGKPLSDVIKMASIVEEEARLMETRQIVAGILWKRLSIKMALQVDSSFKYINGKTSATLTTDDLKIDSPYNSYTNRGLPPTAISNPGLEAIMATITPKKTPYLYFLTDKDGNMHYAVTFEEHVNNKLKYLH